MPGRWTVDFWLDPSCPLTRLTARWMVTVAAHEPVDVTWRVMSLSILNEHRDVDPEGDEEGYLWIPARIAAAVQAEHGHAALHAFYDALWTEPDGAESTLGGQQESVEPEPSEASERSERDWIGDFENALQRSGLPTELVHAGFGTEYDAALRASHQDGVRRVDAEVGTPILAVTTPDGQQLAATFGPVISAPLSHADALRLWQGVLLLAGVPAFRQLRA